MVGTEVKTKVAILYMNDIANPELVKEITKRISAIKTDLVMSPGFIEEFVEDAPFSPFPQLLNTDRPDRAAYNLMEGRVVMFSNESPTALVLPVTFFAFYQSPDDYNSRFFVGSFYRFVRLVCFTIAITLPAIYIGVVAFHFETLPIKLLIPIKESIEQIPFQPLVEALIMELTIELIREAGVRLPTSIGPVIGIVGGLVIGQAVVEANLVSNVMVIIVAITITATASFVVTSNEMVTSLRLLRFPLMILAATFGFIGIVLGLSVLFMHLCALESFGTPYFAPWSTGRWADFKDTIFRFPLWLMDKRPKDSRSIKRVRETYSRGWKTDETE
ncbi:spore germination protein [Paenibacillus montanisoli]|uniref:Spore germination protein n=1 Tax=Paenibacillus montanisoli TaxID=2081970 RepID=A0A328UB93_9BACL|nr:spore germination protein [Paenibacillus montanisoli]